MVVSNLPYVVWALFLTALTVLVLLLFLDIVVFYSSQIILLVKQIG